MNVLVISSDAISCSLAMHLSKFGHSTMELGTTSAALLEVERNSFDVIVIECIIVCESKLSLIKELRGRRKFLPIIVLSLHGDAKDVILGLRSGADDYLIKPIQMMELAARLEARVRSRSWSDVPNDTVRAGRIVVSQLYQRVWMNGKSVSTTNVEFQLLTELARNAGTFMSRSTLIKQIWSGRAVNDSSIVNQHVRGLRAKLKAVGGEDPIVTKRGLGYMLET